ncbi:MAG TPA: hypothetical protein VNO30_50730 [Kofleriaceae bacterium]|nr:hypothetical protein [Kofleriaceae bacterium]
MSSIVDLSRPPYLVVAGEPGQAMQNAASINAAIAAHDGRGTVLLLPPGDIYCDRAGSCWSIRFPPGASRVALRGSGTRVTTLVQHGAGMRDAPWDLLVLDSCHDIEIADLGLRQGTFEHAGDGVDVGIDVEGDHSSLIEIVALAQSCRNLVLENLWFGPCIGDALRITGEGAGCFCEHVRVKSFTMETGGHPDGADGAGLGSRSGVSLRGGIQKLELGPGSVRGARDVPLEIAPGGSGVLEDLLLHDLIVDNSGGQGASGIALAGSLTHPIERMIVNNVFVLHGNVSGALTRDATITNLTIHTSRSAPAALEGRPLLDWSQAHEGSTITSLNLTRDPGSPPGPLVTVIPAGRAAGQIEAVAGLALVDGETFTLGDGATFTTFEFDSDGIVMPGHVGVPFSSHASTLQVRDAIIAVINGEHDLAVTAAASHLSMQPHVVVLTNDHYGRHGNIAITTTVVDRAFSVTGMMGGIGESADVRISGGTWRTSVGPGSGKRYFEARGCRRLSVEGIHLQLGAVGANEYGFGFRSIGDIHGPTLNDISIESLAPTPGLSGPKLMAAVYFAATNGGALTDIRVTNVRAPDACISGVLLDRTSGGSIDASPMIQGCDFAGASNAWLAINGAIDETFPIISGNRGGRTWQVGTADPSAIVAVQGSRYTRQAGDNTTEWLKQSGTGSSGWNLVAGGTERLKASGAAALDRQVTYISGFRTSLTLGKHSTDGYVKHFVVTSGTGELAPLSLVDGTAHVITWSGPASFSLLWDAAAASWRVLGAPRNANVT